MEATVSPSNAANKKVFWTSDNEEVATVDEDGRVTALAVGNATITATTEDGGKKATCM
ncbi:MAG: Ig-like domain-containing protein, partial [Syntrophomonadaceae bacterium]|nr:Ig-like domain-containing protein [Syntrophomonadaceae bacterium]